MSDSTPKEATILQDPKVLAPLLIGVGLAIIPWVAPIIHWEPSHGVALSMFLGAWLAVFVGLGMLTYEWILKVNVRSRKIQITLAIVVLMLVGAISKEFFFPSPKAPTTSSIAASNVRYYPIPLSFKQIFDTDFPYFSMDTAVLLTRKTGGSSEMIPMRVFYNFDDKSKFVAFFIPRQNDGETTCLMVASLAMHSAEYISQLEQRTQAGESKPGESAETWSRDMTFTGRVFIYYEDILSLEQLVKLESALRSNGLAPEFRGQAYETLHTNDKREVRQTGGAATTALPKSE